MKRYLTLLLLLFACHRKPLVDKVDSRPLKPPVKSTKTTVLKPQNLQIKSTKAAVAKPQEYFVDSTTIGRKKLNKIELATYQKGDDSMQVAIRFYSKRNGRWMLKNKFDFDKEDRACYPELSDFNNDGLKDMTYRSARGARMSNELRTLFIYNKETDKLICIKNSEMYPNLLYNKQLNCIDAFSIYGGCCTSFLKLEKDSLRMFANVELFDGLIVRTYDKKGRSRIIFKDTSDKSILTRFKNYRPVEAYDMSGYY